MLLNKKLVYLIFFLISITFINGCSNKTKHSVSAICNNFSVSCVSGKQFIDIYTNKGTMRIELYGDSTPLTVGNFLGLINKGIYDQTNFHRVIREPLPFFIQGGKPNYKVNLQGEEKIVSKTSNDINFLKLRSIPLEIKLKNEDLPRYGKKIIDTKLISQIEHKHKKGSLSMARSENINSANSQFFFSLKSLPILDGRYAVFGDIINGIEILDLINEGDFIEKIIHIKSQNLKSKI